MVASIVGPHPTIRELVPCKLDTVTGHSRSALASGDRIRPTDQVLVVDTIGRVNVGDGTNDRVGGRLGARLGTVVRLAANLDLGDIAVGSDEGDEEGGDDSKRLHDEM